MVEAREKYYSTRSQGFDSSKLLLVMHSSALLLVLKAQHIDSALLVGESTSSRARRAASSFTNKALRSSNLGSSRSSVKYGTAGRGEAINGVKTFTTSTQGRPTHSLGTRKYPS